LAVPSQELLRREAAAARGGASGAKAATSPACAAELQRRLEHTYSKRHRHVEVAAESTRSASAYRRAKLQQPPPPPLPTSSTLIALQPLRPVFLGVSLHFSFPSDLAMNNEKLIS